MKKIVLYDRCKLTDGMMPKPHKELMDEIKEKLTSDGSEIVAIFTDNCSEHVPLLERPEYTKMYGMCTNKEDVEIHVTTLSRLSRNMSWIAKMCEQMHELGYVVTFENEEITSEGLIKSPVMERVHDAIEQGMGM